MQIASAPALDDGDPHLPTLDAPGPARITATYRLKPSEAIAVLAGACVEVEVSAAGIVFRVRR